jgi:hypothetical protein
MSNFISFLSIFLCALFLNANTEIVKKNQIEDIFIWKLSDELQLSAKQEKEFGDIHRSLNKKKSELSEQIKNAQTDLKKTDIKMSVFDQNKLIKKNRILLMQLNQLSVDEFDSMKKLLGSEKFLQYLFLKQELNTKFKSMVLGTRGTDKPVADKVKSGDVTAPVVIEEK